MYLPYKKQNKTKRVYEAEIGSIHICGPEGGSNSTSKELKVMGRGGCCFKRKQEIG